MPTNAQILAKVPLFAGASVEGLERLGDACFRRTLEKEEVLFLEGAPGDALYVVVSGRLRVERTSETGTSQVLGYRHAGEVVGDMALLDGLPRSAQVSAATAVKLLVFLRTEFERVVLVEPGVGLAVMRVLVTRLREAAQTAIDQRTKKVHVRLLDTLVAESGPDRTVKVPFSQAALSDLLGCTREAVSRGFKRLESTGHIERLGPRSYRLHVRPASPDED